MATHTSSKQLRTTGSFPSNYLTHVASWDGWSGKLSQLFIDLNEAVSTYNDEYLNYLNVQQKWELHGKQHRYLNKTMKSFKEQREKRVDIEKYIKKIDAEFIRMVCLSVIISFSLSLSFFILFIFLLATTIFQ